MDGFKITELGKFCLTLFSPLNLLIAYWLSVANSMPKADTWINCFREYFKAILDSIEAKSECIKLNWFFFFSYKIPIKFIHTEDFFINLEIFSSLNELKKYASKCSNGDNCKHAKRVCYMLKYYNKYSSESSLLMSLNHLFINLNDYKIHHLLDDFDHCFKFNQYSINTQ